MFPTHPYVFWFLSDGTSVVAWAQPNWPTSDTPVTLKEGHQTY